jgi:hypothetical protein
MSLSSGSELVRAANEHDHRGAREIENLRLPAVTGIRDLRDITGIPCDGTEHDGFIRLNSPASTAGQAAAQAIETMRQLTWSALSRLSLKGEQKPA